MSQNASGAFTRTVVTVRYFAAAAEAAGVEEERLTVSAVSSESATLDDLRAELTGRYGAPMAKVLRAGSFLVGGRVRRDGGAILASNSAQTEATVDVLPPFAGG